MHPILGNRRRLALYALAWLPIGLLLSVGLRQQSSWLETAVFFLPLSLVYAFVTLSAWYVCRAFPVESNARPANVVIAHVVAGALASTAWIGMARGWAWTTGSLYGDRGVSAAYSPQEWLLFVVGVLLFWLASVFHYLAIAFEASRESEKRALELSLLTSEAELRALRAQIDPHFIFNSLHSISALTTTDAGMAREMCLLLADLLRDTLRLGSNARITLAEELMLADRFLAIERVRLGPRLQVEREIDRDALDCLVPPLLVQPVVENAIVHGIAHLLEGGTIRMTAVHTGGRLTVVVENPCDPERLRRRGTGLGLELLRKRLTAQFGVYDAVLATEDAGRFRVEIHLPAERVSKEPL